MSGTRSPAEDKNTASGPGAREWRILAVVLVGSFMAVLGTTNSVQSTG
jgi:hypothetical protein